MNANQRSLYWKQGARDAQNVFDPDDMFESIEELAAKAGPAKDIARMAIERSQKAYLGELKDVWIEQNIDDLEYLHINPTEAFFAWHQGWQDEAARMLEEWIKDQRAAWR